MNTANPSVVIFPLLLKVLKSLPESEIKAFLSKEIFLFNTSENRYRGQKVRKLMNVVIHLKTVLVSHYMPPFDL